jgi:glycosidase
MIKKILQIILQIIFLSGVSCNFERDRSINAGNRHDFLQVPSPEWEDQILYFIVTDRFMDGDSTNNDQGAGEYKKGDGGYWNGGDLKGITQKINYIKELGITGIWITPPVANQWRNPQLTGTGNHGYWASRLDQVDQHLGDLEDYKMLSATLHSKGMYLIQDVVVNHFGDFYTYDGPYDPEDVSKNFKRHDVEQPMQYPFNHNDARKEEDRELGIYHFAPNFTDHSDTIQKTQFQFADLDDLNTSNPLVRDVLRENFGYWIKEVGVDGFRFDTPHMVEHDFWNSFLHEKEGDHLGIDLLAQQLGKEHFLTAGEVAFFPKPFDHSGTKEARKYLGTKNKPEMNSILNFPLSTAINRVFIEKKSTSTLSFRMKSIQESFQRSDQLLNFIDNHDAPRLLTKSDRQTMRQALLFIMTIPGVPVIYYGTEQELTGMRQAMFKGGVGSIDKDHFDTENEYFKFVQGLVKLRKSYEVFRKGKLKILRDNPYGPGLFIYQMTLDDISAIVLINTSENLQLVDGLNVPTFNPGKYISKYSTGAQNEILSVSNDRTINMILGSKSAQVYINIDHSQSEFELYGAIEVDNDFLEILNTTAIQLSGKAMGVENIGLVIDGDYEHLLSIKNRNQNSWSYDLSLSNFMNGKHRITAIGYDNKGSLITSSKYFNLALPTKHLSHHEDEIGDDHGPNEKYTYPSHSSFGRQQDLKAVDVFLTGNNLTLDITMSEITQIWIPPNGFDHVLLNIYIDMPNKHEGITSLPFQNAFFPHKGEWDYRFALGGFAIEAFEGHSFNSGPEKLGKSILTPFVNVDYEQNKISVTLPAKMLGNPTTLKNANLYINTWSGSATYPRTIEKKGTTWSYGGGDTDSPKIMDDIEIITIKE